MSGSRLVPPPDGGVFRVGRALDPFVFRPPRDALPVQAQPVLGGNRWDDPLGQFASLYCATTSEAAFGETIATFRERDGLVDRISAYLNDDPDAEYEFELTPGRVPPDYVADRYLARADVDPDVRFVDVDHPHTHAAAAPALRRLLRDRGLRVVDRGVVFHADRRITRPIARHFWVLAHSPDHRGWAGLRYESRLFSGWECWSLWEPSPLRPHTFEVHPITRSDPALRAAADRLRLTL